MGKFNINEEVQAERHHSHSGHLNTPPIIGLVILIFAMYGHFCLVLPDTTLTQPRSLSFGRQEELYIFPKLSDLGLRDLL